MTDSTSYDMVLVALGQTYEGGNCAAVNLSGPNENAPVMWPSSYECTQNLNVEKMGYIKCSGHMRLQGMW